MFLLLLFGALVTVSAAERVLGSGWGQFLGGEVRGVGVGLERFYSTLNFHVEALRFLLWFGMSVVFLVMFLVRAVVVVVVLADVLLLPPCHLSLGNWYVGAVLVVT